MVAKFSGRKTDAASVWALGPASTPTDVIAKVFVVPVFVYLSVNADESGFVSFGHPPFARLNGRQFFQLGLYPALRGRFGFFPRAILCKREVLLMVDPFSHQAGHNTLGWFVFSRMHLGRFE